jgi:protein transport protein SEC23
MIPEYAHVGLITYGTHVHVHELGFTDCSKAYVFRGTKEYTSQQVGATQGAPRGRGGPG